MSESPLLKFGPLEVVPVIENGFLRSLGPVRHNGLDLRDPSVRFMPWFDTFNGDIFSTMRFEGVNRQGERTELLLTALSSTDFPFREKRDTSGDVVFRDISWDSAPIEARLKVCFEPARDEVDGRPLSGFKYWFEGESPSVKVHRFLDRQTWEIGGNIDGVTVILRSWLTPVRTVMAASKAYSTAGFEHEIGCMPGNLWGRWTVLPSFDLQRSDKGVLLNYFDEVSLIRTVVEKQAGDTHLRHMDLHFFENSHTFRTNPKTVLFSPDKLDDIDLVNFWTRIHDRERDKARRQFGIKTETPPEITICHNQWINVDFATSYEDTVDLASRINADNVMIDPIWESGQTYCDEISRLKPAEKLGHPSVLDKFINSNQCAVIDWEVDRIRGGETALKGLCDRASAKGVKILSWIATHLTSVSNWRHGNTNRGLGRGKFGVFAAKESGVHPDTGYAADCWALNLNTPVTDHMIKAILGVCERTGLKGMLWDSFSNLGWWQLDYSQGTMRPQFDQQARIYAELANAGQYLMPEAITTFSSHSCLGMYGGDAYGGDDLAYSYDTCVHPPVKEGTHEFIDADMLRGRRPLDWLFRSLAHRRAPNLALHYARPEERNPAAIAALREVFTLYKRARVHMHRRTVLKEGKGVLWESENGKTKILWSFKEQSWPTSARMLLDQSPAGATLRENTVYDVS